MNDCILTVQIRFEQDVVQARQRARQMAELFGFERQDQARIATAVSELARNCFQYGGGGRVEFRVGPDMAGLESHALWIDIIDKGKGIENLNEILGGQYVSKTGMGIGIIGSKKLMDRFQIESSPREGTRIRFSKDLPSKRPEIRSSDLVKVVNALASRVPENPYEEMQTQNQELLQALETLRDRESELHHANSALVSAIRELEETNRGVMVLYTELDEKAAELKRANEIKSRFLSDMSHEFRTPLNSIMGLAQLMLDRVDGELSQEQEKQIGFIKRSAKELSEQVNDLLDLAKVESGKTEVNVSSFKAADLVGTLKGMFRPIQTNASVSLIFEEPESNLVLETDEGKLTQILRNFISNALKFTESGEVRISAARVSGDADTVRWTVHDQGIGIAAQDQTRVFEEYTQVDSPLQKRVKGTGLGLPLTKKFAQLLGGEVQLKSEPGKGSEFSVVLPRKYFDPHLTTARKALLIDDEEVDRYILAGLLSGTEYETVEATNGAEGVRLAKDTHPDVIFLDFAMPDMNAFEVINKLQSYPDTRMIPIIINTSKILTAQEFKTLSKSSVEILSKTFASREVAQEKIRNALNKASASFLGGGHEERTIQ